MQEPRVLTNQMIQTIPTRHPNSINCCMNHYYPNSMAMVPCTRDRQELRIDFVAYVATRADPTFSHTQHERVSRISRYFYNLSVSKPRWQARIRGGVKMDVGYLLRSERVGSRDMRSSTVSHLQVHRSVKRKSY